MEVNWYWNRLPTESASFNSQTRLEKVLNSLMYLGLLRSRDLGRVGWTSELSSKPSILCEVPENVCIFRKTSVCYNGYCKTHDFHDALSYCSKNIVCPVQPK